MAGDQRHDVRSSGRRPANAAMADGTRIDRCHTISASGYGAQAIWIFDNGDDRFIALNSGTRVRER